MTSMIALHAGPAAGFDQPFEMLAACHQRVQRMLALLERLARHVTEHGADSEAQQAAADVLRYFDDAAPHHHEDEERHVLPRLREHGQTELADRLQRDHRAMHAAWVDVRGVLLEIVAGRRVIHCEPHGPHTGAALTVAWDDFAALYRNHIAIPPVPI